MKNIFSTFTILLISQHINSQVTGLNWTTEPLEIPSGTEAKIGTATPDPLFIVTNNQKRIEVDSTGDMKLLKLADESQTQDRLLYITPDGKFKTTEETGCTNLQIPWRLGGNTIATLANNRNEIGTCDNYDFILKAYDTKALWIKPSAFVGIGTSAPMAKLDIEAGSPSLNILKLTNTNWTCNQTTSIEFWNGTNKNFATSRITSSMDGCGAQGEALDFETQTAGSTVADTKLTITNSGQILIGKLNSPPNTSTLSLNVNGGNAFEVYDASTSKINFKVNANGATYIGTKRIQSNHLHANSFVQIDGKVACTELVVIDPTKWADFVFDKNYNLKPLSEVEEYYKTHKHLPEIPSEEEVFKNGINTSEMEALLLQKIEELTLYIVDLNKKVEKLESNKKNKQHN